MDILTDAAIDTLKLVPFLFVTYLIIEAIEHRASERTEELIKKAGFAGPLVGALVGIFPQCGFSAAASTLYAGRVITLGTLIAVYLATSDEMLPVLLAEQADIGIIGAIMVSKLIIGVPVGFVNVVASKELIMETETPYIVAAGRKGGSNIAACICNALLYMLNNSRE